MTETKARNEKFIELPNDLVDKFNGFSLDFGSSVIKVAYLSNEDWARDGCQVSGENTGRVRLTSFSREDLDECLEFLKTNCFMRRKSEDDKPVMYTCGIGGYQYGKKIESTLDVKTQNEGEMDGFQHTMQYYFNNYPLEAFCVKPFKEIEERALQDAKKTAATFTSVRDDGMVNENNRFMKNAWKVLDKKYDSVLKRRPYLLASFGSAWACMKCEEDDTFTGGSFTVFGGRSFLGLGSLLTGAETYEELMALAEKGDNLKLDVTMKDVGAEGESTCKDAGGDMYSKLEDFIPRPVMLWGKAVGGNLANFKREDLARTLLYTMCQHLASTALTNMYATKTHHIFIAGSFISHPLVQRLVVEEFEAKKWWDAMAIEGIDADYHLHILEFGSHFGVIGSFLKGPRAERKLKNKEQSQE